MTDRTILLAEDNRNDELLTIRALKKAGVKDEIVVVTDGVAVLDYLHGKGEHEGRDVSRLPMVLLLDLKLPRLTGLEVLERIRAEPATKQLPIVVLTSSDLENDVCESYRLGANSYVQKPVGAEEFSMAIESMGRYWTRVNKVPGR